MFNIEFYIWYWPGTCLQCMVIWSKAYLVLLCPVVNGVSVPGLEGGGAGGVRAAALSLQPWRTVRVKLAAYWIRRAHRQLRLGTLKQRKEDFRKSSFCKKIKKFHSQNYVYKNGQNLYEWLVTQIHSQETPKTVWCKNSRNTEHCLIFILFCVFWIFQLHDRKRKDS